MPTIGVAVYCTTCSQRKKPIGRDAPMEMASSLCDDDCPGYRLAPKPSSLWPGEENPHCALCGCEFPFHWKMGCKGRWATTADETAEESDNEPGPAADRRGGK